jgi:oxygen-independent coproporphyrinogen-3 oxidase
MPTGLYVHIPFCKKKCPYCSFVVSIGQEQRMDSYLEALSKEASVYRGQKIDTVYIGGGTPSRLAVVQIEQLFETLRNNFKISPSAETTFEVNPDDALDDKLKALKRFGVNRISLGIQSFNNSYLKFLGRVHDADKAIAAYDNIRKSGYKNISVDLMFTFPGQTQQQLEKDLETLVSLKSNHVSIYALTIEEKSRFFVEKITLPPDSIQEQHFNLVVDFLNQAGFKQYEVSNFARKGYESKHNFNYWRGGDYIGLGIGAHSHQNGVRFWNIDNLFKYIELLGEGKPVIKEQETLGAKKRMIEVLLFGLRTSDGVRLKRILEKFKTELSDEQTLVLNELIKEKYLIQTKDHLKTSKKGMRVLDEISRRLI